MKHGVSLYTKYSDMNLTYFPAFTYPFRVKYLFSGEVFLLLSVKQIDEIKTPFLFILIFLICEFHTKNVT